MGAAVAAWAGLEAQLPPMCLVLRLGWASMTLLALSSFVVPYVDRLADHGKLLGARGQAGSKDKGRKASMASSPAAHALDAFLNQCTVPKRWFWHFYAFSSLWTALLLWALATDRVPHLLRPSPSSSSSTPALVGLVLLEMQALRRLWESLHLFQYGDARMHLAGYLVGFAHYAMAALTLVADPACWEEDGKRRQQGVSLATVGLIAGVALFVGASIEQYRCHAVLAALRKPSRSGNGGGRRRSSRLAAVGDKDKWVSSPSPSSHALPRGHWGFRLVACPHYTCEALLYLALALLFASSRGGNSTAGLLATWVAVNLGVTAEKTRRWYRQR